MALPQHLHEQYQFLQQQQVQRDSKSFRNLYETDGHISPETAFYKLNDLQHQSHHPPYVPLIHVVGFAPGPIPVTDGSDSGVELQWNYGKKTLKEQDFLESNSPMSSLDFLQPQSVSMGLGLSLDNTHMDSTRDSPLLSLIGHNTDLELQRQDGEIDRLLKVQADRLRQSILEKVQASQLQTVSLMEERILQKLREKETELQSISKRNVDLEQRMEQLSMEAGAWQQRARNNENVITALELNLQQVYAQTRDSKEGCGDSEVDDTASFCNGRAVEFNQVGKDGNDMKELMSCKGCRVNEVCMLLLPCKHLCLCKDCESKLSFCPLCRTSKFIATEVYL